MTTQEQLDILRHALGLNDRGSTDAGRRNRFATTPDSRDGVICQQLVSDGLMDDCGLVKWTPGERVYRATGAGKLAAAESIKPTASLTRSQRRYAEFLSTDCGLSFGEWIKSKQGAW